jgi:hypothetical protein
LFLPLLGQYTQGTPYFALAVTVTAPPAAPLLPAELDAEAEALAEVAEDDADEAGASAAGTTVAPVPRSTST